MEGGRDYSDEEGTGDGDESGEEDVSDMGKRGEKGEGKDVEVMITKEVMELKEVMVARVMLSKHLLPTYEHLQLLRGEHHVEG